MKLFGRDQILIVYNTFYILLIVRTQSWEKVKVETLSVYLDKRESTWEEKEN